MARVEIAEAIQNTAGQAISGASVQVNLRSGGAATLYAGESGGTTVGNPRTSDTAGRVEAWVDEGSYDLVVSKSGFTSYTQPLDASRGSHTKVVHEAPLNVKYPEYGASPAASAATNATALSAAFAAASTASGGEVYIPAGVYSYSNLTSQQTLTEVTIFGDGKNATRLQPATNTGRFLLFAGTDVGLKDLAIGPSSISASRTGDAAVEFSAVTDARVENCEIFNTAEISLAFANCQRPKAIHNYVHDSKGDGIHFVNCNNGMTCRDNHVKTTGDDLIACWAYTDSESDAMYGAIIEGNTCESGTPGSGIVVGGSVGVAVIGNTIGNTQRPGIRVCKDSVTTKACRRMVVQGNILQSVGTSVGAGLEVSAWDGSGTRIYTHFHEDIVVTGNVVNLAGNGGYIIDAIKRGVFSNNINTDSNENNGVFSTNVEIVSCTALSAVGNVLYETRGTPRTAIGMYLKDLTDAHVNSNVMRGMTSPGYTGAGTNTRLTGYPGSANADTSGATLGQLETEVNEIKLALRNFGVIA